MRKVTPEQIDVFVSKRYITCEQADEILNMAQIEAEKEG